jgi:DNA-binding MarR family transcriptional regulator
MENNTRKDVNVLTRDVESFAELDPHMQLSTMLTFLFVAQRGECIQKDVEQALGFSNAAASRNISYWTESKKFEEPGLGMIERVEDPRDRRQKNLRLTKRGTEFYNKLRSS